jgi:hypothetical protein
MSESHGPEARAAYRTLNDPTRLLGLSVGGWATLIAAGAIGYGWLLISPLPWRANVSLVAIALGLPATLMVLREQSTVTPARLLVGVVRWRVRPSLLLPPSAQDPVCHGGLRLDRARPEREEDARSSDEPLWPEAEGAGA